MQPGVPPAYPHTSQQQQPPGARPVGLPGHSPAAGQYANGPGSVQPPGTMPPGGVQPLAGQLQQMKLGGAVAAPLAQPGLRPPAGPMQGAVPSGARPVGTPGAAPGSVSRPVANGVHAAGLGTPGSFPQQHMQQQQRPLGAHGTGATGLQQQRPPGMPGGMPGMRPPVGTTALHPQPGTMAPGMRPPGPSGAAHPPGAAGAAAARPGMAPGMSSRPGMPAGAGLAPQPPAAGLGMAPPHSQAMLGMTQPMLGQPAIGPARPAAGGVPPGAGFSTPRKDGYQQQAPHGTPPPFAVQVASPSPTKRVHAGGVGGFASPRSLAGQQQQQQQQGLGWRPPMHPIGGAPSLGMQPPPPQQFQQPAAPGMMPGIPGQPMPGTGLQQHGMQHGMPGQPPLLGQPLMSGMPGQPRHPMPTLGMQASPTSSTKVDPSQIPRPMPYAIPTQVFETRLEDTHAIPPAADAPIVVRDRGSAGPRFMRSTLNMLPQSADILKGTSLPLVAVICPMALQDPGDDPVQVVDWGERGPVRCQACKAYVNPYMRFIDGGRTMQCNFCGANTEVAPDYQCNTGPDGERRDKYARPELCRGSVEMSVTPEYQVRPPMKPTHFFLIDVSQPAVASGATAAVCSSVARILDDLPGGERTQVCIATFDSTIHFYSMRPGQTQPHMLVVPDVTDVYCPLPGNVVVNLRESRQLVDTLLESIPKMFAGSQVVETCGGAALRSAVQALKGGEGGRLHAFLCTLPRRGTLHLRLRDVGRPPTDRDQLDSMLPENKEYVALASDAADHQVSIDLFVMAEGYADLATLGTLCAGTCGSLYHWPSWSPQLDADEFFNDLRWAAMRPQALEAVGRLRCSRGLAVDKYIGSFHRRVETDLNFPTLSCDHAFAAKLLYEEKLPERGEAYLQFALLYSTTDGQRRVRVHTLALPITQSVGTTFRGADLDAYMSYVSRKVSSQVPGHALGACKEAISKATADALLAYRTHCAAASSSGQLILPEALKLLPLYSLALSKSTVFRNDVRPDVRAAAMWHLLSLPAHKAVPFIYPRFVALHTLLDRPANALPVPDKLWLSAEKLDPEGVFLLENGQEAFIYVGKAAAQGTLQALFGVPSLDGWDPQQALVLPTLDTPLNKKVRNLLDEIRRQRTAYLRLRVVRRGDPTEPAFFAALVEDRSPQAGMSYVEHLCFLHRQIQNKLE